MKEPAQNLNRRRIDSDVALWALIALYAIARVSQVFPDRLPVLAVVALHIIPPALFALIHGAVRYGLRGITVFFTVCFVVGGLIETIGVQTNFPYGSYYFTEVMGPKLVGVPILLALAYVGTGYLAWTLANVIVTRGRVHTLAGSLAVTVPLVASFIMVAWDLAMDPVWSTVLQAWIWRDGGLYFGVPVSNFLGWFLTVYVIFQLFAGYLRRSSAPVIVFSRSYWDLAVVFYAISAAGNLLLLLPHHGPSAVTDPVGTQWQVAGITAATALVSMFLMGSFVVIAWARLYDPSRAS